MIIKGAAAQNIKFWSKHLLNDAANEKAEVRENRGTLSQGLEPALWEMKEVADGSRCGPEFSLSGQHQSPRRRSPDFRNNGATPSTRSSAISALKDTSASSSSISKKSGSIST